MMVLDLRDLGFGVRNKREGMLDVPPMMRACFPASFLYFWVTILMVELG